MADRKVTEELIKKEAYDTAIEEIVNYRINFRCSALFMIREKHSGLDLSGIDFFEMKGYDKLDRADGFDRSKDQGVREMVGQMDLFLFLVAIDYLFFLSKSNGDGWSFYGRDNSVAKKKPKDWSIVGISQRPNGMV